MAKMFLLIESVIGMNFSDFQSGIDDLILIEKEKNDVFYKNDSLNYVDNYGELYQQYNQENQFRAKYLEQLTPTTANPKSIHELAQVFPNSVVGFFGMVFPKLGIDIRFCVWNNPKFIEFKLFYQTLISASNFSDYKEDCFPNIVFCDNSAQQLIAFGAGKFFVQCLGQFVILEAYLKTWTEGSFNLSDINKATALNISPESQTTMGKFKHERLFSLPNGGSGVFELHIKLGDKRIHILEDNVNKKVMVGYIGPHLTI